MSDISQYEVKRVFIASPGDLTDERKLFPGILEHVNAIKAHNMGIHFEPLGWEDTLPGMGRPQELINSDVDRCDLFIMLLWRRWGTPSGEYSSGTEEEFELACKLHRERRKPADIWLYFREVPDAMMADPGEQLTKVLDFRKKIEAERTCLYKHYPTLDDWDCALEKHLCEWLDRAGTEIPPETPTIDVSADMRERLEQLERELEHEKAARESVQRQLRQSALRLVRQAMEAAADGRPTEAEQYFATANQIYPEPRFIVSYANFLAQKGSVDSAEMLYKKALEADPKLAVAWINLGRLLGECERYEEAEQAYRHVTVLEPTNPNGWCGMGVAVGNQGRQDEAREAYSTALGIDASHAPTWVNLGVLLQRTGSAQEAEEAYRRATEADPSLAVAWSNLGAILYRQDRHEEAETALRKSVELDPEDPGKWCFLGDVLDDMSRTDDAEQAYRRAVGIDQGFADAWYNLAVMLRRCERCSEAEQAYRKAMEGDPEDADNWIGLASLLCEQERYDEAELLYQQAIASRAYDAGVYNAYAYYLCELHRLGEAEAQVNKALEIDPSHCYANATLGLLQFENGSLEDGRNGYEKAIQIEPENLALRQKYHYEYGRALARSGREDEALDQFTLAQEIGSDYVSSESIGAEIDKLQR